MNTVSGGETAQIENTAKFKHVCFTKTPIKFSRSQRVVLRAIRKGTFCQKVAWYVSQEEVTRYGMMQQANKRSSCIQIKSWAGHSDVFDPHFCEIRLLTENLVRCGRSHLLRGLEFQHNAHDTPPSPPLAIMTASANPRPNPDIQRLASRTNTEEEMHDITQLAAQSFCTCVFSAFQNIMETQVLPSVAAAATT